MSLLEALDNREIRSTSQLADMFGISVELIEAKLERYEQLGLVKKTQMNASATCGGSCKKCKGCNHENESVPVTFWEKV